VLRHHYRDNAPLCVRSRDHRQKLPFVGSPSQSIPPGKGQKRADGRASCSSPRTGEAVRCCRRRGSTLAKVATLQQPDETWSPNSYGYMIQVRECIEVQNGWAEVSQPDFNAGRIRQAIRVGSESRSSSPSWTGSKMYALTLQDGEVR
jgi:hypothetical protein